MTRRRNGGRATVRGVWRRVEFIAAESREYVRIGVAAIAGRLAANGGARIDVAPAARDWSLLHDVNHLLPDGF
jgi:hypothetical protein